MQFIFAILISALWMLVNGFLLMRLVKLAVSGSQDNHSQQKNKILILSLLKFPLLYVAGFFILKSRFFPIAGILIGLTAALVITAIRWVLSFPNPRKVVSDPSYFVREKRE